MFLVASSLANAAESTGKITSINPKTDAITLDDGKVFILPEGVEAETLKVGMTVKVVYSVSSGKMKASKVVPVK